MPPQLAIIKRLLSAVCLSLLSPLPPGEGWGEGSGLAMSPNKRDSCKPRTLTSILSRRERKQRSALRAGIEPYEPV